MLGTKLVEQAIERTCLSAYGRSTVGTARMDERSVHVPFHEGNVMVAQQPVQLSVYVGECRLVGEIQHDLVTRLHRLVSDCMQHPIGMVAHHHALQIRHFRLHPNAEVHPK